MNKIKGYLLAGYRGSSGDSATEEEIQANIQRAVEIGFKIRLAFSDSLDLYIPHQGQEILHRLWLKKIVTSEHIVDACCEIIQDCDLGIVIMPISFGMIREIKSFSDKGEIIYIDWDDDDWYGDIMPSIAHAVFEIKEKKEIDKVEKIKEEKNEI